MLEKVILEIKNNILKPLDISKLKETILLSKKLSIPEHELLILAWIYDSENNQQFVVQVEMFKIFKFLFALESKRLRKLVQNLERKQFIQQYDNQGVICYLIPSNVVTAIDDSDWDFFRNVNPIGLENCFNFFHNKVLKYHSLNGYEVDEYLNTIIARNSKYELIKYIKSNFLYHDTISACVLMSICTKTLTDNDSFNFGYLVQYIGYRDSEIKELRKAIHMKEWPPIREGFVEIDGDTFLEFNPKLMLTAKGIDSFFDGIDSFTFEFTRKKMGRINSQLIKPEQIKPVKLVFRDEMQLFVNRLGSFLSKDKYTNYIESLDELERMKGITVLFHGPPGSGKTELALQLSKVTGRSIMKVQVSDFLSKWVGESEANLKQIFKDYKKACFQMDLEPILFFNECDQIIGKRMNTRNSTDQMMNGIQNIILEEMETFEGILIGTTNLISNMDSAFERRWSIKLKFDEPDIHAIRVTWQSLLPEVDQKVIEEIMDKFEFSIAEIANIVKRYKIEKIMGMEMDSKQILIKLCESEKFSISNKRVVGF